MVERAPSEYLTKILELSREMVSLAGADPGYEMDIGCRTVFGALFDYGYSLKKMAEKELAAHQAAAECRSNEPSLVAVISSPEDSKTVLIVDEDRNFLEYLSVLFQSNGFDTLTAVNGHQAIERASASGPDLIVLDVSMPGKSALSLYQDLQEDPELGAIPVVLVTALGDSISQSTSRRRQMPDPVGIVAKPVDVDLLWEAVRGVLPSSSS
ncbi:unnamed protein product [marine sediment metagenome]|uniref:Response regulatory domain-containing protein n=1 Tax=marine sediment metagenome TaxID=412755 RepID=X0UA93_9ZZZZ